MIERTKDRVEQHMAESQLPNVGDAVIALNPAFTPSYGAQVLELTQKAGYQIRVVAHLYSLAEVPYAPSEEATRAASKQALRTLMKGMHDQAVAWLDANPEQP